MTLTKRRPDGFVGTWSDFDEGHGPLTGRTSDEWTSEANRVRPPEAIIAPAPFVPTVHRMTYAPGETVAELLCRAVNAELLDAQDLDRTNTYIDGVLLEDREAALDYRPLPGQLVNIAVAVQGGGGRGGGAKAANIVLQVASAAAYYFGGPLAAAAVQIGGQLAMSALFKPKVDGLSTDPTYSLEGASNQQRRGQSMPLVCGEGRFTFDSASSAYSTFVGDEVFLTAIYCLHYGPCTLTGLKLGETLFSDLADGEVEYEQFLLPGPRVSQLYPMRDVQETYSGGELEFGDDWTVHTTAEDAERVEFDLTFPSGLYFSKDNGKTLPQEVRGRFEYSLAGADTWAPCILTDSYFDRSGHAMPVGDWYVQARSKRAVRRTVRWTTPAKGQYDVRGKAWDPDGDDADASTYTTQWSAMRTLEDRPAILDETAAVLVARFKATSTVNGQVPAISGVITPICPVVDGDGNWTGDPTVYSAAWQPTSNAAAHVRYIMTGYPAARPLPAERIHASFITAYRLIEEYGWHGSAVFQDDVTQQDALTRLGLMGRFGAYWNGQALCAASDWEKPAPKQLFAGRNAQGYRYNRAFPDKIHGVWVEFGNLDQDGRADAVAVYADGFSKYGGLVDGVITQKAELLSTYPLPFRSTAARAFREGRVWLAKRLYQSENHSWTAGIDGLASTFGDRVLTRHTSTLFGEAEARVQARRFSGALVTGVRLDTAVTMKEGVSYALDVRRDDGPALRGLLLVTTPGTVRNLQFAAPLAIDDAPRKDDLIAFGRVDVITEDLELIDVAPSTSRSVALKAQPYRFADILAAETGPMPELQTLLSARARAPKPVILARSGSPDGAVVAFALDAQRTSPIKAFIARWRETPSELSPGSAWETLPLLAADRRELVTPAFPEAVHIDGDVEAEYRIDIEIRTALQNGDISDPATVTGLLIVRGVPLPINFTALGVKRIAGDGSAYPALAVSADAVAAGLVHDLVVELQPQGSAPEAWESAGQPLLAENPKGDFGAVKGGAVYDVRAAWRDVAGWRSPWVVRTNVLVPAGSSVASDVVAVGGELVGALRARVTEAQARADGAAGDARNAALALLDALASQAQTDELIQHALHTPDGLPLGPTAQEQMVITADSVETIALFAVKTEDGAAVVSTGVTVIIDPATGETRAERDASLLAADGANSALIAAEETARVDGDAAEAALRLALRSDFEDNVAEVGATLVTLSDADSALSALIVDLSSTVDDNKADADLSISTLTDDLSALSSVVVSLNGEVDDNKADADLAITALADDLSALASAQLSLSGEVDDNKADVDLSLAALADDTSAIASSLTTLNASVDGLDATVTTQGLAIADHDGKLLAYAKFTAAAGGNEAYIEMVAASDASLINLVAKSISLGGVGDPVITVEGGVARISNAIIGGAQIEELTLGTTRLMDNAVQETQVSVGSGPLYGNDTWQAGSVTKTITMDFPGIINVVAFGDCIDGGGHSASYHASGINILLRDVTYDLYWSLNPYEVAGENATSRLPCFGSYEAAYPGDYEITLQFKSRPADYFEQKGIMITRFYK